MRELRQKFLLMVAVRNGPDITRNVMTIRSCHVPFSLPVRKNAAKKEYVPDFNPKN